MRCVYTKSYTIFLKYYLFIPKFALKNNLKNHFFIFFKQTKKCVIFKKKFLTLNRKERERENTTKYLHGNFDLVFKT